MSVNTVFYGVAWHIRILWVWYGQTEGSVNSRGKKIPLRFETIHSMYIVRNVIHNLCDTARKHQQRNRSQKAQPGGRDIESRKGPDSRRSQRQKPRRDTVNTTAGTSRAGQAGQGRAGQGTGARKSSPAFMIEYPGRDSGGRETLAAFTDILPCSWSTIINSSTWHVNTQEPKTQKGVVTRVI